MATAAAAARADGGQLAARILERGRLEVLGGGDRAVVEGRAVEAPRVALWVSPGDRVLLRDRPDLVAQIRRAVASAIESPDAMLRELLVLQERSAAVSRPKDDGARGYRESSAPAGVGGAPSGEVLAATAAALARADKATELAQALGRAAVALEPLGSPGVSRIWVALDPADFAVLRRDPRVHAAAAEAVEIAARTPRHRAADVTFVVRVAPGLAPLASNAEVELAAAARRAGWGLVAVQRTEGRSTLALIRDGVLSLLCIVAAGAQVEVEVGEESIRRLTVGAGELADEAGALRVLERLEGTRRSGGKRRG